MAKSKCDASDQCDAELRLCDLADRNADQSELRDGYDPMLGILHDQRHKDKDRTPSFALDLMEPLRPVVDRAVLKLISNETFSGADFQLQSDGVCRLNPELRADSGNANRACATGSNSVGTASGIHSALM